MPGNVLFFTDMALIVAVYLSVLGLMLLDYHGTRRTVLNRSERIRKVRAINEESRFHNLPDRYLSEMEAVTRLSGDHPEQAMDHGTIVLCCLRRDEVLRDLAAKAAENRELYRRYSEQVHTAVVYTRRDEMQDIEDELLDRMMLHPVTDCDVTCRMRFRTVKGQVVQQDVHTNVAELLSYLEVLKQRNDP